MDANMPPGSKLVLDRHEGRVRWRVRMPDGPLLPYPAAECAPVAHCDTAAPARVDDDALDAMVEMVTRFVHYRFGDEAAVREGALRAALERYVVARSDPPARHAP